MVAKSFQNLEIVSEIFEENNKEYVYVQYPDGHQRKVRWYEEPMRKIGPTKDALGFKQGFIYLVKGDTEPFTEWLRESDAIYRTCWGWAFETGATIPELPNGLSLVKLFWEDIADVDLDELKPKPEREKILAPLLYEPSSSQWQGEIGDRLEKILTVIKTIPVEGYFGNSTIHIFSDPEKNIYVWTTAAKILEVGKTYVVRGSVKQHKIFKNVPQTILTRCAICQDKTV